MSLKHKIHVNAHYTRSVNLERDASSVDVISAYIPTSRALKLFKRVADSFYQQTMPRAWSLIGPYGSGKSSCSVFLSQLLSSPKLQATQIALEKLKETAPDIAKQFERETKKSSGYLQVLITGSPEPLWKKIVQGLSDAAENFLNNAGKFKVIRDLKELAMQKTSSIPDLLQQVEALQKTLASKNCKGICFVIDELGKFLEFEARHYGANDIYLLQSLAEHACKPSECNLFLFVLLHQSFEQYAKGLGESLKNEWSKVQGRFEDIPFLESAEQVLRIVGSAFSHKLTPKEKAGITEQIKTITQTMGECSALPGVIDEAQATKLFYSCYPLHPVSAILLPILCQKIAQNERTLFSYLGSREEFGLQNMIERMNTLNDLVCPHHIYDYFITNQPAALGDYTTHRRWAEVVTAIDRLGDAPDEQIRLLKTIGLLNIIGAKGGLKPSKQLLETCGKSKRAVANSLKALIDKSIITFRRFSGEYRVWQGSDFDLEEALQQSLDAIGQFSLATELNHINAFMPVVARRYTIKSGALRYFIPEFVDAQTYKLSPAKSVNPRIIFFLAMTQDDEKIFKQSVVQY
ncbi:MAG: hypothetical protein OXC48_00135 [Endozoicomonadaceae bacterium]|nr:hypothetical protein [Endozoicomonadaceae bacterium]